MRDSWMKLVGCVLRPARPRLEKCLVERGRYLEARRLLDDERARAIASCTARIEALRAEVFAANDGVVTARMTELEREWRRLSRSDRDGASMDLWARIAPPAWIDRKRWRDADPSAQLDAAVVLASDPEGVEAAEAAASALRTTLASSGVTIGPRIRWRSFEHDFDGIAECLARPLGVARDALSSRDGGALALDRACQIEREVHEAAKARFPERAALARVLAHASFVDGVWRGAALAADANPVTPLVDLWKTGYVLSAIDEHAVTLEMPDLEPLPSIP